MVKQHCLRLFKWFGELLLVGVIIAALVVGVTRAFFPYIGRYRAHFEQLASQTLQRPVKIGSIAASWQGLYPTFRLNQVQIFDPSGQQVLLAVDHFQVGINLLSSVFHWQMRASQFHLTGTHFTIHQLANDRYLVNSIPLHLSTEEPQKRDIQSTLEWLLTQGNVTLDHLNVDWYGANKLHLPLTDIQLKFDAGILHHQVIGLATLQQSIPFGSQGNTRLRLVLNIHDLSLLSSHLEADGYVYLENLDLGRWFNTYSALGMRIVRGRLPSVRVWVNWRDKQLQSAQAVFDARDIALQKSASTNMFPIDDLQGHLAWERTNHGWNLASDDIQLTLQNATKPLGAILVQHAVKSASESTQVYRLDHLNLSDLTELPLPDGLLTTDQQQKILQLHPTGLLKQIVVRDDFSHSGHAFSAAATLEDVSWKRVDKIPGVRNIQGQLKVTPNAGELQLSGKQLTFDDPTLFEQPWVFTQYAGLVQWLKVDGIWKMQTTGLMLQNPALKVQADVDLSWQNPKNPYVHLLGSAQLSQPDQIHLYLPSGIFSPKLRQWLSEAFSGSGSVEAEGLLQGPILDFPFNHNTGRFEILAHAHQVDFQYAKEWPPLTQVEADVLFDDRTMQIAASKGNILGIAIQPSQAEMLDLAHSPLVIQGGVNAQSQQALQFLANSPLNTTFGDVVQELAIQGLMQCQLALTIPLHEDRPIGVEGQITLLPNNVLTLPNWHIQLTELQGKLSFTQDGLFSNGLQGTWLGAPVMMRIGTQSSAAGAMTRIDLAGRVSVSQAANAYGIPKLTQFMQGDTAFTAGVTVRKVKNNTKLTVTVNSNLQGIRVSLPEPLAKSPLSIVPSYVTIEPNTTHGMNGFGGYGDKLAVAASLQPNSKGSGLSLKSAEVKLGAKSVALPNTSGITLSGQLAQLDWDKLSTELARYMPKGQSSAELSQTIPINRVNLQFNQVSAFGLSAQQVTLQAHPVDAEGWALNINSPTLMGQVFVPQNLRQRPIEGNFQRFVYTPGATQSVNQFSPGQLPNLTLNFQNFYYGSKFLGRINLMTASEGNTLWIDRLTLSTNTFNLAAKGRWQGDNRGSQTVLTGNINASDLGSALKAWSVTSSLKNTTGHANFVLSWPAAAYSPDFGHLNGNFSLNFKNGRIINISQNTEAEMGIGRILNLLSLQNVPRRLSLDFSDLFASGFPFDVMKGDFRVKDGNAWSDNAYLNGPIAKVTMQGRIGLGAKDYDLMMVITPYVTSSIPVVATLAAGPIAGAAAWVANKVFGGVVNQITAHSYHVTGSWDNPQVDKVK